MTSFRDALSRRVLVADGAMGTMLQAHDPSLEDFQGLEGCNEVLNVTRPDVVAGVHDAYLSAGADVVETNTFGANWAALGEYDISHRIGELSAAGARIARERADHWSEVSGRRRYVLGSMGPGTKLPSLGHTTFAVLREGYRQNAEGLIEGGADGLIVETCQDLLQVKAAVLGARDAVAACGRDVVLVVQVTIETNGAMLLGSEIGAALGVIEPLGADVIGLNCATGPAEMSEHLRYLARHCDVAISCMPNAGLPELTADGARYPLGPSELAEAQAGFVEQFGVGLVGGCCGTTPEHIAAVARAVAGRPVAARRAAPVRGAASLYAHVPFSQDASYLAIGERTNANGSRVFREAMLAGRWEE
ncbi:homocysteine S-methyltransferase family protein, partial [Sphaerisporangium sp. B11E5]|uniref:homocysteine S-methyltransferase family protein n=1 Tax=Sphaerisporangium sp. B11E5 TaxID=3153563 RepID=UPI00325DB05B